MADTPTDAPPRTKKVVKKVKKVVKKTVTANADASGADGGSSAAVVDEPEWGGGEFDVNAQAEAAKRQAAEEAAARQRAEDEARAAAAAAAAPKTPKDMRIVSLILLDGQNSKIQVNEFTTGRDFMARAAAKVDLIETSHFDVCLMENGQPSTWLSPDVTLYDQGVTTGSSLCLKVHYFASNILTFTDPTAITIYYAQVLEHVLSGAWPTTRDAAYRLASYKMQIDFEDYQKDVHKPGFLVGEFSLDHYLPPLHMPSGSKAIKEAETAIYNLYQNYVGEKRVVAMINYVKYCDVISCFGCSFYSAKNASNQDVSLGVGPRSVASYTPTREVIVETPFSQIASVGVSGALVSLTKKDGSLVAYTLLDASVGPVVLDLLNYYLACDATGLKEGESSSLKRDGPRMTVEVHLVDGEYKRLFVYPDTTVQALMNEFATKIDLVDRRYFGLCERASRTDRWLDPRKAVMDQFVTSTTNLVFKLRYFFVEEDHMTAITDPVALHLYYLQFKQYILDGDYVVSESQAIDFACHAVLAEYSLFDPTKHHQGFLMSAGMSKFIPSYMIDAKVEAQWEVIILKKYSKMDNFTKPEDVERAYIAMARQIPTFGLTYFNVTQEDGREVLLAVGHQGIVTLEPQHFHRIDAFLYKQLKFSWEVDKCILYARVRQETNDPMTDGQIVEEENIYYTQTPIQGLAIANLAKVYYSIAYKKATAGAAAHALAQNQQ